MFAFFWDRVGNPWLLSRTASRLFAASATAVVLVTVALWRDIPQDTGVLSRIFWGAAGISMALGAFFLWSGMWRFWKMCDTSSRTARRLWFLALLFGLWYGAALYYVLVYLRRRPYHTEVLEEAPKSRAIKLLLIAVWTVWILFAFAVSMLFAFPKQTIHILGPISFKLFAAFVLILSFFYKVLRAYHSGITRKVL